MATRYPKERSDPKNLDYGGLKNDPYDEELVGAPALEEEPIPSDILPDQIQVQGKASAEEEEQEVTARPKEDFHPIPPNELPEG